MIHSTTGNLIKNGITAFILFFFISIAQSTFGQVFPVQANINVTPPYTVYLSNYTSPQQQRVMVNILLHDPVVTSVDVRFKFSVEGGGIRLYTNPGWIPQPFTLTAGIPSLLTADIIAEYFQPQHLIVEGVNPQEFFRSGKLPEGFYQFKVEVLEYQRGVTISNIARTGVWLLLNEAPKMVFPTPNQKVLATNPQMLNFSWIPGGITSPLSAQTTMYEFTMVELQDGMDPTVAITTASDAIKYIRTTQQTSLLYGPSEPQLMPGKRYAIRIKAYNTEGYEVFKNNGYSDVRVFQFGDACNPPILFTLVDETQSTFSINVTTNPGNTSWIAQFRENTEDIDINSDADSWSELKPEMGVAAKTVKGLKSSTAYQVQVKATCGGYTSDFLPAQTVTTTEKVNSNRSCNNSTPVIDIPNAQPLEKLKPNDLFLAALFPIKVIEVTKQSGGKFTGKGVATLPLFNAGLAVSFADVGINEAYILTSGEVIADRNETGMTLFGDELPPTGGTGDGTGTTGLDTTGTWPPFTDTISIDVPFDSIVVVNDSTIWVIPTGGGEAIVVGLGGSTCTLITPPDGNMDNAQVVYNGAAKPYRSGSGSDGSEQEQFTGFLANFSASNDQHYGFDSLRNQVHANYYQEMVVNGKTVKLPWKALAPGKIDPVKLRVKRSADTYPYSNLKVGILGGTDLQPVVGANTASQTYSLTGATDGDETPIVATFTEDGKTKYAGGIWTATYQPQSFKLFIVPFPKIDISEGDIGRIQNELNQIYSQAVVGWTVQPMNGFSGIDLGDNGLDWAESDMLSSYDAEMNSVISAFKDWKENPDPDAYYLFVIPKFSEGNIEGFMPRNRRFGFITADQLNARTVAHELGHGAFNLRHTFPEATQGSTDNLMDYPFSEALADKYISLLKAQWDLIHNPETTTGLFDDMEDGAAKITFTEVLRWNLSGLRDKRDSIKLERALVDINTTDPTMYTFLVSKNIQITNTVLGADEYGNASTNLNYNIVTYVPDVALIKKDAAGYDTDMPLFVRLNAINSKLDTLYAHIKNGTTGTCPIYSKLYYKDKYKADTLINRFNRLKASYTGSGDLNSLFDIIFLSNNPFGYKTEDVYQKLFNSSQKKLCDDLFAAPPIVTIYVEIPDAEALPYITADPNQVLQLDFAKWFGSTALPATAKTLKQTTAHEMGHLDFFLNNIVKAFKWMENQNPALGAGELVGGRYPHNDAQHCSQGAGHAFNNPGGKHACSKESMY